MHYLLPKSIIFYIINELLIAPFTFGIHEVFDIPIESDISRDGIPSSTKFVMQIIFLLLVEDFFFYIIHRFLHWRVIYPYIHKWHHEHKITIAITANFAHPIEFIANLLSSAVGTFFLGKHIHMTTVWTWYAIRILESVEGHSGYDFTWSIS